MFTVQVQEGLTTAGKHLFAGKFCCAFDCRVCRNDITKIKIMSLVKNSSPYATGYATCVNPTVQHK